MKSFISPIIVIMLITVALPNCATKSKRSRKPVTSIKINKKGNSFVSGTNLTFLTNTKIKNGSLKNIKFILDGTTINESDNLENEIKVDTKNLTMGFHTLKVLVTKEDGVKGENYKKFEVISDIIPTKYSINIKNSFPHNTNFFTQGFQYYNGFIYEGTGQRNESGIFKTNLKSGKTLQELRMDDKYWGEGITIMNNKIYQLTYTLQTGFVYDLNTFETIKSWNYKYKEGWGLTNDGNLLIMSDGSDIIRFLNPETFKEVKRIHVYNNREPVAKLNELEYINGEIWANVWTTFTIVRIDPYSGKVLGEIDMKPLNIVLLTSKKTTDVLNGIAWDKETNKIYVTGKLWPNTFEIEVIENK
jgi:glutamine cyclotransferase